jgi:hypothetical protein
LTEPIAKPSGTSPLGFARKEAPMIRHASRRDHTRPMNDMTGLLVIATVLSAAIHVSVVPDHLEEYRVFGLFFVFVAGAQIAWAIAIRVSRSAVVLATGAALNMGLIGAWAISRTTGVPIGPDAWMPEPIGGLDVAATLLELLALAGILVLTQRREPIGAAGSSRSSATSDRAAEATKPCCRVLSSTTLDRSFRKSVG